MELRTACSTYVLRAHTAAVTRVFIMSAFHHLGVMIAFILLFMLSLLFIQELGNSIYCFDYINLCKSSTLPKCSSPEVHNEDK